MAAAYDDVCLSAATFKVSHNSYYRKPPLALQLDWDPAHPAWGGCRGIEFDLHQTPDRRDWLVAHAKPGPDARPLWSWLADFHAWRGANPDHDPIFLHLELKKVRSSALEATAQLESVVTQFIPKHALFTPAYFRTPGPEHLPHPWEPPADLYQGATQKSWPRIGEVRGRVIVCLSGGLDGVLESYAARRGWDALFFADRDATIAYTSYPSLLSGWRIVLNCHVSQVSGWTQAFPWLSAHPAFLTRAWQLGNETVWDGTLALGANMLATDKVFSPANPWAHVGDEPFEWIRPVA